MFPVSILDIETQLYIAIEGHLCRIFYRRGFNLTDLAARGFEERGDAVYDLDDVERRQPRGYLPMYIRH